MKHLFILLMTLMLCISLFACNNSNVTDTPDTTKETESTIQTEPPSAREQLTTIEKILFNNLLNLIKNDYYDPANIRISEVVDYESRSKYKDLPVDSVEYSLLYGPDTVVVRLQGGEKINGAPGNFFMLCIKSGENISESAANKRQLYAIRNALDSDYEQTQKRMAEIMRTAANEGDYVELFDYQSKKDASAQFNIGRLNNALKEYWEGLGF